MVGDKKSPYRPFVLKRFDDNDIYITSEQRDFLEKSILENKKFVRLGFFTIILSTISAIQPIEELRQ